jgi:hypothetical protein
MSKGLSYKARRRWSLVILLIGLPLYISLVSWISGFERFDGRLPLWAELLVYIGLGFLWIIPFKAVFRGVGQSDPETPPQG